MYDEIIRISLRTDDIRREMCSRELSELMHQKGQACVGLQHHNTIAVELQVDQDLHRASSLVTAVRIIEEQAYRVAPRRRIGG